MSTSFREIAKAEQKKAHELLDEFKRIEKEDAKKIKEIKYITNEGVKVTVTTKDPKYHKKVTEKMGWKVIK